MCTHNSSIEAGDVFINSVNCGLCFECRQVEGDEEFDPEAPAAMKPSPSGSEGGLWVCFV
jgi:hypothetical protein